VRTTPDSTCALLVNGKVYCWGSNYFGQLGNRKIREPSLTPQEVVLP
jgi:alpha-tubulin suppressor-like RCC1 family protein